MKISSNTDLLIQPVFKTKRKEKKYSLIPYKSIKKKAKSSKESRCPCEKLTPNSLIRQSPINEPTISFLLNCLGWLTQDLKQRLDRIVKISVGFFDIECETSDFTDINPVSDIQIDNEVVNLGQIAKQYLQLIGYTDNLTS